MRKNASEMHVWVQMQDAHKCTAAVSGALNAREMHDLLCCSVTTRMRMKCAEMLQKSYKMLSNAQKQSERELHPDAENAQVCGENAFAKNAPDFRKNPTYPIPPTQAKNTKRAATAPHTVPVLVAWRHGTGATPGHAQH